MNLVPRTCPLCHVSAAPGARVWRGMDGRSYWRCPACQLVFGAVDERVSARVAAEHYRQHENGLENAGYVTFLRRGIDRLLPFLAPGMRGLDFGCGPEPTLARLIGRAGMDCEAYDPLFWPKQPAGAFDFVFATECFEHFEAPRREVAWIVSLMRPGGYLCVMTECWKSERAFSRWYYTRDPTHIVYFHAETFGYLGREFGLEALPSDDARVWLFRKGSEDGVKGGRGDAA